MGNEDLNRIVINAFHDGIFLRRFKEGENPHTKFTEVNEAACRLSGYTREELLGLSPLDLTPSRKRIDFHSLEEQCRNENKLVVESVLVRKDGAKIPVEIANHYFEFEDQVIGLSIVKDVTDHACDTLLLDIAKKVLDREPVDQILRMLCGRLVGIFDLLQAVVGLKQPDGSIKMLGWGLYSTFADQFIAGRWDEGDDQLPAIGKVILSGQPLIGQTKAELLPWHIEALSRLGDGVERFNSFATIPLVAEGSVIGGLTLASRHEHFWDERLVERLQHFANQAAIAIVASAARQRLSLLRAGFHAAANAVMVTDVQGTIQWINPAFTRLTGYEPGEVMGQTPRLLKSGRQDREFYRRLWETITAGNVWQGELVNRRKDGSFYTVEATITPVKNELGEIVNFISIKQDITEKLKAIEESIAAKEVRARAEKLFSLGTLAAGISHEINQPLNSIKMISSGIVYAHRQGRKRDVDEIIANVEEVSRQADRITGIISHLRSFFRKDEQRTEKIDINVAAAQAIRVVGKQLAAHGILLETQLSEAALPIKANLTSLEEIVINLLVNAMQALDTTEFRGKRIVLRTFSQDECVVLSVSNNGPGIDAVIGDKIFEPFYSTKGEEENLGLGLAIVQSLVRAGNGSIRYESDGKTGVEFLVMFPAVEIKG